MKNNTVLVIGGTGKTGRKVAQGLVENGVNVRIGSRSSSPSFDWNNSETWDKALEGMDGVYITYQPDLAVPGAVETIIALTERAAKHNIKKIVLLSGRGEQEAERCEAIVMGSGLNWTIVRADWFNQNFSESFFLDPILSGHVVLPRDEAKIPFIDTDDIADVVVSSFIHEEHNGKIHELTGPRLLTFQEVTEEIAAATGRNIKFSPIDMNGYMDLLKEHHVPEDYLWLIRYLFTEVLDGRNANITNDVEKVLGRKPKDFSTFAKETAANGTWNA